MASKCVVLFSNKNPYFLSGFVNSASYIRGMVENGGYNLYIVKDSDTSWAAHHATSRAKCTTGNKLADLVPSKITIVTVPETMFADYNTIINWAKGQIPSSIWQRGKIVNQYYVMNNGHSWFVKEAEFFRSQGGLTEPWGKNWKPIWADSVEHACLRAIKGAPVE